MLKDKAPTFTSSSVTYFKEFCPCSPDKQVQKEALRAQVGYRSWFFVSCLHCSVIARMTHFSHPDEPGEEPPTPAP